MLPEVNVLKKYPIALIFVLLVAGTTYWILYYLDGKILPTSDFERSEGNRIYINAEDILVTDGDTIRIGDLKLRFLGVDAPEMAQEPYGDQAKHFVEQSLSFANEIYYLNTDNYDRYGRLLTYVFVDNQCLSILLITNKLAYETISHYGEGEYPVLAAEIQDAAAKAGSLPFMEPRIFKSSN